jgi:hypothetical protein
MENLSEYFDSNSGIGVLATADHLGKVNAAIYARPHFLDETTALFIMAEKLTHANLENNPNAVYLFIESGDGYKGKRLYLKKHREERDEELLKSICQRCDYSYHDIKKEHEHSIVYFKVEKVLPLIGE